MPSTDYAVGHVKHDAATGQVAIRTIFPDDDPTLPATQGWLVATTNRGANFVRTADVDGWDDLFTPTAGS